MNDKDDQMTEAELAELLGVKPPKKVKIKENPNDIYAVSARINNAARGVVGANLTPQGVMVCNTFANTLNNFYDFAEKMRKSKNRDKLMELIRNQEAQAGNLIAALGTGVRIK